jgi:hypothetical protein
VGYAYVLAKKSVASSNSSGSLENLKNVSLLAPHFIFLSFLSFSSASLTCLPFHENLTRYERNPEKLFPREHFKGEMRASSIFL